jgi:hypothetical protein
MKYPYDQVWHPAKDPQGPLGWRKSCTVRVNLSGQETDNQVGHLLATAALLPQHVFQVLAQHPQMYLNHRQYLSPATVAGIAGNMCEDGDNAHDAVLHGPWPLPNVHLGAHITTRAAADEKVPTLLKCQAARWFAVVEPSEAISLTQVGDDLIDALRGCIFFDTLPTVKLHGKIHWVELRGSTGPDARPMHPDWARQIRDECKEANVDFWFSGWGEWAPQSGLEAEKHCAYGEFHKDGEWIDSCLCTDGQPGTQMFRVGSRKAGRLLDGIEHNGTTNEAK